MKKILFFAAAIALVSCAKNKDTKIESENTVIETKTDTMSINTDTIGKSEAEKEIDNVEVKETTKPEENPVKAEVKPAKNEVKAGEIKAEYASFGDRFAADNALSKDQMLAKYKALKPGDTVAVKFKSKIKDVCSKKGCWMAMELPNGKESFVKFKDYAFFVPLNAAEQDAVISGKAFVSEVSVAQLRHYAKDGGKSEQEIAKITEPKTTYGFMADGVLISK